MSNPWQHRSRIFSRWLSPLPGCSVGAAQGKRVSPSQRQPTPSHPFIQQQRGLSIASSIPCSDRPLAFPTAKWKHSSPSAVSATGRRGFSLPSPCLAFLLFPSSKGTILALFPLSDLLLGLTRMSGCIVCTGKTPGLPGRQWHPPWPRPSAPPAALGCLGV